MSNKIADMAGLNALAGYGMPEKQQMALADALLSPTLVETMWFNHRAIKLDGYAFRDCRFDNCTLTITSTHFQLINCKVDPSTKIIYAGKTINVIQLFTLNFEWDPVQWGSFVATKNPDGTISLGG
jgi:hypothetical protein